MDKFAASHINGSGPTLKMTAEYSLPAGSEADPALDDEGKEIEGDVSGAPLRERGEGRISGVIMRGLRGHCMTGHCMRLRVKPYPAFLRRPPLSTGQATFVPLVRRPGLRLQSATRLDLRRPLPASGGPGRWRHADAVGGGTGGGRSGLLGAHGYYGFIVAAR